MSLLVAAWDCASAELPGGPARGAGRSERWQRGLLRMRAVSCLSVLSCEALRKSF